MAADGKRGCLAALFGGGGSAADSTVERAAELAFQVRADFLSDAELAFFRAVEVATSGRFRVFPKVNLGDVFYSPTRSIGDWNRINTKHVDFLLWDRDTRSPVLGIELDDSSHAKAQAAKRDALKDAAFAGAGLPLLRIPTRAAYSAEELRASIDAALAAGTNVRRADVTPEPLAGLPACPNCGVEMVIRESARGRFYGCSNYPRCRGVRPIAPSS